MLTAWQLPWLKKFSTSFSSRANVTLPPLCPGLPITAAVKNIFLLPSTGATTDCKKSRSHWPSTTTATCLKAITWRPCYHIFLPQFAKGIIFKPASQVLFVKPFKSAVVVFAPYHYYVFWLKIIHQCRGLGRNNQLCFFRHLLQNVCQHLDGIRVQA